MKKFALTFVLVIAVGALSGCSLVKKITGSSDSGDEVAPVQDAATDAVPAANPENPQAPQADADALAPAAPEAPPAPSVAANEPVPPPPAPVEQAESRVPASTGETQDYSVQAGDTLMKIAFETYGDLYRWKDIYETNKAVISNPQALVAGTVLKLEKSVVPVTIERNGEKYLIKRGDTLGTISNDVYGTPSRWKTLWKNNKQLIRDPNKIFAGFFLYYMPEQKQLAPAPLAEAAPSAPSTRAPASVTQPLFPDSPSAPPVQSQ